MTLLIISKPDFEGRIDLSVNLNEAKRLNQHILHAEDFDLRGLMGDKFYYYFISQFQTSGGVVSLKPGATQQIKDLYNGSVFTVDDVEWSNPGVKPVLVYFAGARLIKGIDAHITPTGYRDKVNEFSEPVGSGRKAFQANEYENQALSYWSMIETFMKNDKSLFPQYFGDDCGCDSKRTGTRPRTIPVGNTCNNNYGYGELRYRRR